MKKFWNWVRDETTKECTLYLNGVISDETWWGDEITPKMFKDDLLAGAGNVTVLINSPGGGADLQHAHGLHREDHCQD